MPEKRQFVAVHPDGREYFVVYTDGRGVGNVYESVAENAVGAWKLTTKRSNPQRISIKVYDLVIQDGKLARHFKAEPAVMPDLTRMTEGEYRAEMDALLAQLPPAFRSWVESEAWDRYSCNEEVVSGVRCWVLELVKCIKKYDEDNDD